MTIVKQEKPNGYEGQSHFYKNEISGHLWKVHYKKAENKRTDIEDAAPLAFALTMSISIADADGKAKRDSDDRPLIMMPHTHNFNEAELSEDGFDFMTKVEALLFPIIERAEKQLVARDNLTSGLNALISES